MYKRRIAVCVSVIMILTISVLVASNYPPESTVKELEQPAKFVLSSWDYPDEYGQGIYGFFLRENSTGVFLPSPDWIIRPENDTEFEFEGGFSIKLDVRVTLNYTFFGLTHPDDIELGINYIRLNVIVTSVGQPVFSQQNFTYNDLSGLVETGIWYYSYIVVLNFILVGGEIYKTVLTYEIFW